MKPIWCWRCRAIVPGLEPDEFGLLYRLHTAAIRSIKFPKPGHPPDPPEALEERLLPVAAAYRRISGEEPAPKSAWLHHALSHFGPPCSSCSLPLRTPLATYCAACGADRAP